MMSQIGKSSTEDGLHIFKDYLVIPLLYIPFLISIIYTIFHVYSAKIITQKRQPWVTGRSHSYRSESQCRSHTKEISGQTMDFTSKVSDASLMMYVPPPESRTSLASETKCILGRIIYAGRLKSFCPVPLLIRCQALFQLEPKHWYTEGFHHHGQTGEK